MPSLDALISQWTDQLRATHPELAPHLGELADHVRSSAQDRIDDGAAIDGVRERRKRLAGTCFTVELGRR